ncbi:hypothetical protein J5N97_024304 [Dioscorea zingiberensis]|uniref:Uncharacterized protein n=1 Tax=Dioscorea zingiberensis TaxID=325984 RepID=A0A9D5C681_9LILI|nr:hypothetical protein J5N97_024304 [Dioscorea zingiberensis]
MGLLGLGLLNSFGDLPLPDQIGVAIHASLLLLLLFFVSARRVLSCAFRRAPMFKDDRRSPVGDHPDAEHHRVVVGYWFKIAVCCCFYNLLVQVVNLCYETARLIGSQVDSRNYSVLYLPSVQALSWLFLGLSTMHCRFKVLQKFPFLIRLWWFLSFLLCMYTAYVDVKGVVAGSFSISSHAIANFAATPAIVIIGVVSVRGVTGLELYRDHGDLQEPLLAEEEEPGCLRVTPYGSSWDI